LVAGGYNRGGLLASTEIYNPATGAWTATGSMTFPRANHTATAFLVANSPKVLVTGGGGVAGPLVSCELWDVNTGQWMVTGSLATPRSGHTATIGSPGANGGPTQVVAVGGTNNYGFLTSAEVYDIPTGNWSYTSSLPANAVGRFGHTASVISAPPLLEILVAGGANIIGGSNNDAYIYNPAGVPTVVNSFTDVKPDTGRGGRNVAVAVNTANSQVAISASESGGLFKTSDGGQTWAHIDSFPPFRMADVEFVPAGFSNPNVVVATTPADANFNISLNNGGIWTSDDAGSSWTHVTAPTFCQFTGHSAYGLAFLAPSTVYVAGDCGLVANSAVGSSNWAQTSNWKVIYFRPLMAVAAQSTGASVILDICLQGGGGQDRSSNGGANWRGAMAPSPGPNCESTHSIEQSPLETNVVFATTNGTVVESDDGGSNWISLVGGSFSGRPHYVRTRMSPDGNPAHFDMYYSGRDVTCSNVPDPTTGQRCPFDSGGNNSPWRFLPTNSLNHDINEIGFDPATNCALYEAGDFGLFRKGPAISGNACGDPGAWSIAGNSAAGLDAMQLYDLAGQVQYPISGLGVNVTPFTNLFFGTQDNGLHASFNAAGSPWPCFGGSGFCDPEGSFLQIAPLPISGPLTTQVTLDSLDVGTMEKSAMDEGTGALSDEAGFTGVTPPGNGAIPYVVAPNTYVAWSGTTLYLTPNSGQSWSPLATVRSDIGAIFQNYHQMQLTSTLKGPALVEAVASSAGTQGIILLTDFLPAPAQPLSFSIQTLGGLNSNGQPSGLQAIWGTCFGQGAWYCAGVYAVDPNDYHHMYAVDSSSWVVSYSLDGGLTWKEDSNLTNLINASGVIMQDSIGNSQVHAIAFDPRNSSHILVGTDQAGIFASASGGTSWSAVPNTTKATAITSFFFDDNTRVIYVGTYGRGLWKLTLDWSSVH
jgi:photosystem II stability/assembly factor-like uncharacterized protein